ncbi:peptide-methionine (S)-S-oxide reductase MsrA [Candidatus Saccharibacteria bacterium]|nr:peptide-methionine (S)-S-oxide reductase MsrA [Candidatus Saccharibacteria bacterium]
MHQAIFAAGCFWGVQYYFDQVPGVKKTTVGYTGGKTKNPTYEQVCYEGTGHAEAVLVEFEPKEIHYETLVRQFFRMHDPTQLNRQGPDVGDQYRSAIFTMDDTQTAIAENVRDELEESLKQSIATVIERASEFYTAEDYHQKYAERTGRGMCHTPYEAL